GMMRVDRQVVPEAKSCCSTSSVRRPARAHSRAMATPLIPPPITTTWKRSPSSRGRALLGRFMVLVLDALQHNSRAPDVYLFYLSLPSRLGHRKITLVQP